MGELLNEPRTSDLKEAQRRSKRKINLCLTHPTRRTTTQKTHPERKKEMAASAPKGWLLVIGSSFLESHREIADQSFFCYRLVLWCHRIVRTKRGSLLQCFSWIRMSGIQDSNSGFGNFVGGDKSAGFRENFTNRIILFYLTYYVR